MGRNEPGNSDIREFYMFYGSQYNGGICLFSIVGIGIW